MRKFLLATAAALVIATPAAARDGAPYIGIEGGLLFPKSTNVTGAVDFTDPAVDDVGPMSIGRIKYKTGYDVDAILGYDLGMFRLEGELGYKRSKLDNFQVNSAFVSAVNAGAGTTDVTVDDFDLDNHVSVLSGMVNALVDFNAGGVGVYAGGGFGRARVKVAGVSDSSWAWQLIAGVYAPISDNIDVGLKYRYFRTGHMNFSESGSFTAADVCDPEAVCSGGVATIGTNSRFSSHSILASLTYNFGGVAEALPPPPPPPPPAAPETQTCPDGSVILATDACPAPPPPPPPPPPPAASGERGR